MSTTFTNVLWKNVSCTLDENGTLTITGGLNGTTLVAGDSTNAPWREKNNKNIYINKIITVVVNGLVEFEANTSLSSLFSGCESCISINLTGFDTSNVTDMNSMFMCDSVKEFSVLQSITFGNKFNTSNVTNMSKMFSGLFNLTSLDLSNFDTSKVTDMSSMFMDCSKITTLDLTAFNTSKVTDMSAMFMSNWVYDNTKSSTLKKIIFGDKFDTSNVTNMNAMFHGCMNLKSIDLTKFNTRKVIQMEQLFEWCGSLTELDLSSFDTTNVTSMFYMFGNSDQLVTIKGLKTFNTFNCTNMSRMFENCYNLIELDLSSFDTTNVTDMSYIFYTCKNLVTLILGSQFNIHKITESTSGNAQFGSMFIKCAKLKNIIYKDCTVIDYLNLDI